MQSCCTSFQWGLKTELSEILTLCYVYLKTTHFKTVPLWYSVHCIISDARSLARYLMTCWFYGPVIFFSHIFLSTSPSTSWEVYSCWTMKSKRWLQEFAERGGGGEGQGCPGWVSNATVDTRSPNALTGSCESIIRPLDQGSYWCVFAFMMCFEFSFLSNLT